MEGMGGGMGGGMGNAMGQGTAAIGTLITSYMQFKKAKEARKEAAKLKQAKKTPAPIIQNNLMARNMAGSYGLPGQANMQNQLDADTANTVDSLVTNQQSPAAIAYAAIAAYKNQMQQDAKLGVAAAQNQQALTGQLFGQNNTLAQYDEKNFNYNVAEPYMRALAEAAQLEGAAVENANKGLQQQGNAIGSLFGGSGGKESPTTTGIVAPQGSGTGQPITGQQQPWGGMGPQQQAWGGYGQKASPQINEDQVMNYRMKTGDYASSNIDIMGKMYNSSYSLQY